MNKRSKILGFTELKNKVHKNAFDLSHRHMFTAQIGELLPVLCQWVNPNETFDIKFDGFTRTQPLQSAAFTRLRENIQYYFVPFQSLWKYFEQQVNNMTVGQSGENISRIALSAIEPQSITTGMPYLNYNWFLTALSERLNVWTQKLLDLYGTTATDTIGYDLTTVDGIVGYLRNQALMAYNGDESVRISYGDNPIDVFGCLKYCRSLKLLRALGYLNTELDTYDIVSSVVTYRKNGGDKNLAAFKQSQYGWSDNMNYFSVDNAPNLSIFPLLAYHKIVEDHYRFRQWQQYDPTTCNIDYLLPTDSMNFAAKLGNTPFIHDLFTLEQSNFALDYFNGVLPKAQYGDESAATIDFDGQIGFRSGSVTTWDASYNNVYSGVDLVNASDKSDAPAGTLISDGNSGLQVKQSNGTVTSNIQVQQPHNHSVGFNQIANGLSISDTDASLRVSVLRNALALQKYKEIQNSNDSDFASQVLAHFGIKPKHNNYESRFIGGSDSTLDINPQVNQNLTGDNNADIKAIASGTLKASCKFTSDTYGVIIGIYRCTPQLDYAKQGIDRNLFKTDASDFPLPELDSIGMQSQYRCEVAAPNIGCKTPNYVQGLFNFDMSDTYGYLPRFAELKTSYDRYEGAFLDSLKSWVTGIDVDYLRLWLLPSKMVSGVHDYFDVTYLLRADPHVTDNLFVNQLTLTCNDDRLLIGSVNTVVAVRPYSVYGLPYSN